jgi:hypothetical protein
MRRKRIIEVHAGNRLHDAPVAQPQAVAVDRLHAADIRGAELRERNAVVAVERARHAGRPQQLVAQMAIDELMDVAQILQQFPGLLERRRHQLDQDSEKSVVMCSLVSGAPSAGGCGSARSRRRRDAQRLLLDALAAAAQHVALARIDQAREAPLELLVNHVYAVFRSTPRTDTASRRN